MHDSGFMEFGALGKLCRTLSLSKFDHRAYCCGLRETRIKAVWCVFVSAVGVCVCVYVCI